MPLPHNEPLPRRASVYNPQYTLSGQPRVGMPQSRAFMPPRETTAASIQRLRRELAQAEAVEGGRQRSGASSLRNASAARDEAHQG